MTFTSGRDTFFINWHHLSRMKSCSKKQESLVFWCFTAVLVSQISSFVLRHPLHKPGQKSLASSASVSCTTLLFLLAGLSLQQCFGQLDFDLTPQCILFKLQYNTVGCAGSDWNMKLVEMAVFSWGVRSWLLLILPVICCQILFGSNSNITEPFPTFRDCSPRTRASPWLKSDCSCKKWKKSGLIGHDWSQW